MNFAEQIERALDGEPVEAVVIGNFAGWDSEQERAAPVKVNKVLSWTEARMMLDYAFDSGFGGADCHPVYVWTAKRVLFVHEYDGSTWIDSVPRAPGPCEPEMS